MQTQICLYHAGTVCIKGYGLYYCIYVIIAYINAAVLVLSVTWNGWIYAASNLCKAELAVRIKF